MAPPVKTLIHQDEGESWIFLCTQSKMYVQLGHLNKEVHCLLYEVARIFEDGRLHGFERYFELLAIIGHYLSIFSFKVP